MTSWAVFMMNQSKCSVTFLSTTTKNLLADSDANLGTEDLFKSTIGNQSLLEDSAGNGVKVVK